jgi:hypothetical protein
MSEFSDLQRTRASEAYLRYCNGIWVAQEPQRSAELIGEHDTSTDEGKIEVVELSEELMQSGARDFLQESFPDGMSTFQEARTRRDTVEATARNLLEEVAESEKARLDEMNPAFWRLRPAPFLRGVTMTRLLHGDYEAIPSSTMLGDFAAHALIRDILDSRTLRTRNLGGIGLASSAS